jgi:hypothetical protein
VKKVKKKRFSREEYMSSFFNNNEALEKELKGIPIRAEITSEEVVQEYLPVLEYEYYIDVWDCEARLGKRRYNNSTLQTEIIPISEQAKELFNKLIEEREVILNRSGHYYIETREQRYILDRILIIEGLRDEDKGRCFQCDCYCSRDNEFRNNPYDEAIHNYYEKEWICDYCYHQLEEQI